MFDEDEKGKCCSYLEHKASKTRTAIHDNNGSFQFTIRVPRGEESVDKVDKREVGNEKEGFPRPGTLMADLFY